MEKKVMMAGWLCLGLLICLALALQAGYDLYFNDYEDYGELYFTVQNESEFYSSIESRYNEGLSFYLNESEIIRFEQNGDIYINGNLTTNDLEVVEGFRKFIDGTICEVPNPDEVRP